MTTETSINKRTAVHDILRGRGASQFNDDAELGAKGLGFDSIAIAETLLDCEKRFGMTFTDLLDGNPITVGSLIARAERA